MLNLHRSRRLYTVQSDLVSETLAMQHASSTRSRRGALWSVDCAVCWGQSAEVLRTRRAHDTAHDADEPEREGWQHGWQQWGGTPQSWWILGCDHRVWARSCGDIPYAQDTVLTQTLRAGIGRMGDATLGSLRPLQHAARGFGSR